MGEDYRPEELEAFARLELTHNQLNELLNRAAEASTNERIIGNNSVSPGRDRNSWNVDKVFSSGWT